MFASFFMNTFVWEWRFSCLLGKHVHEDAERIDSANADGFADYEGQLAFGRLRRDPALMSKSLLPSL